ncbi:MAG: thiamine pyrophosphate-dependent enzyme, partial [Candidatus Limnocylindrales bacterium]
MATAERPGTNAPTPARGDGPDLDARLAMYRTMVRCRQFEERAQQLFFEGLVRGTTHLGNGQEAVAAGFAAAMRADDYTFCTYRGHNHT